MLCSHQNQIYFLGMKLQSIFKIFNFSKKNHVVTVKQRWVPDYIKWERMDNNLSLDASTLEDRKFALIW